MSSAQELRPTSSRQPEGRKRQNGAADGHQRIEAREYGGEEGAQLRAARTRKATAGTTKVKKAPTPSRKLESAA